MILVSNSHHNLIAKAEEFDRTRYRMRLLKPFDDYPLGYTWTKNKAFTHVEYREVKPLNRKDWK